VETEINLELKIEAVNTEIAQNCQALKLVGDVAGKPKPMSNTEVGKSFGITATEICYGH
jgi:hypothetical protein